MANWNDTIVHGVLDVTKQYYLSDYLYNMAKLEDENNNESIIFGEETIKNTYAGNEVIIKALANLKLEGNKILVKNSTNIIGTSEPPENGEEGQIYFKIID